MPFIILGRQRFELPIGETRIGGAGAGALPFPQLAGLHPTAVLRVTPDGVARLMRSNGSRTLTIDGSPVGSEPVTLAHGAKIGIDDLRLIFGDIRESGATMQLPEAPIAGAKLPFLGGETEPTADTGGRLTALESGLVLAIPDGGLTIGRDPESGLVIRGSEVSRRHAMIRSSIQGYILRDVSTNGTYVNGRRVDDSQVLGMRDVIRIGDEQFRFEADPASYEPSVDLRAREPAMTAETPTQAASLEPRTQPRLDAVRHLATLEIVGGAGKGTQFRVERPVVHIGRGPRNDVTLSHSSVADSHATLTQRNGAWIIVDRGSASGTLVNGQRVVGEHALTDKCVLRFGAVTMRFRLAEGAPAESNGKGSSGGMLGRLAKLLKG